MPGGIIPGNPGIIPGGIPGGPMPGGIMPGGPMPGGIIPGGNALGGPLDITLHSLPGAQQKRPVPSLIRQSMLLTFP